MVRVLFFGATADAVGTRSVDLNIGAGTTPTAIVDDLAIAHPALKIHRLLFAVNENYVDADVSLSDGDEVAIFTAVSGG